MIIFRKILLIFILLCLCKTLVSQASKIDSLENILASMKKDNLEKGVLLIDLSRLYLSVDTTKSRKYVMEALNLAQKAGFENLEQRAYHNLGLNYYMAKQDYLSHVNYKKAEKLAQKINDMEALLKVYNNMGILFFRIEDWDNTVFYADKLLEVAAKEYDLTTLMPYDTLRIIENDPIPLWIFGAQLNKGWARYYNDQRQESIDFYVDMFQKSIILNANPGYVAVLCGQLHAWQNRHREALYYLHWARIKYETDNHLENRRYLFENERYLFGIYANIAKEYAKLNIIDSADYFMKKINEITFTTDINIHLTNYERVYALYGARIEIASVKGDYLYALESAKKYSYLTDSIAKSEKSIEMANLRNWLELEQQDHKNKLLQQGKQNRQIYISILQGAIFLIIALFIMLIYLYRKTSQKNLELNNLHTVKDKLFSIVSNNLRNPLGNLISVLKIIEKNKIDEHTKNEILDDISKSLDDACRLIDNLLRWAKSQMQGIVPQSSPYFDIQEEIKPFVNCLRDITEKI